MTENGRLIVTIKQFVKCRYAWPGGYEIHLVLSDGECVCHACTVKHLGLIVSAIVSNSTDGWKAIGTDINYESTGIYCAQCSKQIEPAYESNL